MINYKNILWIFEADVQLYSATLIIVFSVFVPLPKRFLSLVNGCRDPLRSSFVALFEAIQQRFRLRKGKFAIISTWFGEFKCGKLPKLFNWRKDSWIFEGWYNSFLSVLYLDFHSAWLLLISCSLQTLICSDNTLSANYWSVNHREAQNSLLQ